MTDNKPIRIFTGFDPRETVGWYVFVQSLLSRTKSRVAITPLQGDQRDGTNAFTYERFTVPQLCNYEGYGIFLDGADMLMRADIADLWALRDSGKAVQVVKHTYQTKHAMKYIGTDMMAANRDYPCKNWSSVVLWNCAHPENKRITKEFVRFAGGELLHRFGWLADDLVGSLPRNWNHLVGEYEKSEDAKIAHFTLGIPAFDHYRTCDYADEWYGTMVAMADGLQQQLKRTGT